MWTPTAHMPPSEDNVALIHEAAVLEAVVLEVVVLEAKSHLSNRVPKCRHSEKSQL